MKVTKFPQSCLLLEKEGWRIAVDPGSFFVERFHRSDLGNVQAALYTHQHADHYDPGLADVFRKEGVPMYGNQEVCSLIGEGSRLAEHGRPFEVAGFLIEPRDIGHFTSPQMPNPPKNTGYIIDGTFLHPGDGVHPEGLQADHLGLPIGGPTGEQFVIQQIAFAKAVGAKKVIPMHYDFFKADPEVFRAQANGFEVLVLKDGESAEL
jgi:L-ascorbate metabolism protein UlaG (beta-lactamase superfamily)